MEAAGARPKCFRTHLEPLSPETGAAVLKFRSAHGLVICEPAAIPGRTPASFVGGTGATR